MVLSLLLYNAILSFTKFPYIHRSILVLFFVPCFSLSLSLSHTHKHTHFYKCVLMSSFTNIIPCPTLSFFLILILSCHSWPEYAYAFGDQQNAWYNGVLGEYVWNEQLDGWILNPLERSTRNYNSFWTCETKKWFLWFLNFAHLSFQRAFILPPRK